MNLNWNDTHGWDDVDRRYNMPKGTGRITRDIKDFNISQMTTVSAISKVGQYLQQEKTKENEIER